jgi:hypothetical protein
MDAKLMNSDRDKQMTEFLLGRLPETERAQLEERFASDDGCFEELLMVEEELRDAYARGELSNLDREAFEQRLLVTAPQRNRQQFAQALARHRPVAVKSTTLRQSRWKLFLRTVSARPVLVPVFSVIVLTAVVAGVWLSRRSSSPASPQINASIGGSGPSVAPRSQAKDTQTIAFVLTANVARSEGEELPKLVIHTGVSRVRLQARVRQKYPAYQSTLETVEGRTLWSATGLHAEASEAGEIVNTVVPANVLPRGDYILTLKGRPTSGPAENVAEYSFRVRRR